MSDEKETNEIADAARVEAFLADPAVERAFAEMDARNFAKFKDAVEVDDVMRLHAKTKVVEDFRKELRIVIDAGARATATRAARSRRQ